MNENDAKYLKLQRAIHTNGGVDCEELPDLFFPEDFPPDESRQMTKMAIKICKQCPVQRLCLDFAISSREPSGIWGGTTASDR
jgi:WhiB family redox-sensing transcriptional regulator